MSTAIPIASAILYSSLANGYTTPDICTTPKCIDYAKFIKNSLAPNWETMDPCSDFDKYSCAGWKASNNYRADQTSVSVTSVMSDTNSDLLHALLEGEYANNSTYLGTDRQYDQENFKKMKLLYNTCMTENTIKTYDVQPIRKLLNEFESVFPLDGPRNISIEELTGAVAWLEKLGVSALAGAATTVRQSFPLEAIH
jgi:endothelin-converting enzyme